MWFYQNEKATPCTPPPPKSFQKAEPPFFLDILISLKAWSPVCPVAAFAAGPERSTVGRFAQGLIVELKRKAVWFPKGNRNDCSYNKV